MITFLNIGHTGRIVNGRFNADVGAVSPDKSLTEVDCVWRYVMKAHSILKGDCIIQSFGDYQSQSRFADSIAKANPHDQVVWVACHMNAGQGDYGLVLHDARSMAGRVIATDLGASLKAVIPSVKVDGSSATNGWSRAHKVIDGVYSLSNNLCGIVYEPMFIDGGLTVDTDRLDAIGNALAQGLINAAS